MVEFSNITAGMAAVVGLLLLIVGRIPVPGRHTATGVLARLAGLPLVLLPWPGSQGLALLGTAARHLDGMPPDKPETVQLIAAFIQLVLLFWSGVATLVLIFLATVVGKRSQRAAQVEQDRGRS